jgi:hypothetical protein
MHNRILAALAAGVTIGLLLLNPHGRADAQPVGLLTLTSEITYDIKTVNDAVRVTWDAKVTNNDPASTFRNGSGFYYFSYPLPILHGATNVSAVAGRGQALNVELVDVGSPLVQSAAVSFDRGIFYGETYSFRLTYDVVGAHSRSAIVTPYYAYVAVVAAGDPATVNVNIPGQEPWSTSLEGSACAQEGTRFTCSGSQGPFVVAIAETAQPGRTGTLTFDVPLAEKTLNVSLKYFEGDEATAQHQQALVTAGLPMIEAAFGFRHPGPSVLNITQGGQQAVLGYEGLTGCDSDSCDIVISPIASDYTVLHELAHLWTGIFEARWLSEGSAELVANIVATQLPEGLVTGAAPERAPATIALQLDDWGPASSLIGADPDRLVLEDAGYDYSHRFLLQLRSTFGMSVLQAVNRNIATSGSPADSRRYMDLLEEATGRNADNLFLTWVFPESYRTIIDDRREARDRLAELSDRLASEGLSEDILAPIKTYIGDWDFGAALASLDRAESGMDTYVSLLPELDALRADAERAGLKLPATIEVALTNFDFDAVRGQLADAKEALSAYTAAAKKVHAGRGIWTKFGLLGSNPNGALRDAAESFANGDFETSRIQSEHARDLIDGASGVAFRRLLLVAGLLAILALAVGIALAVGHLRERELAER